MDTVTRAIETHKLLAVVRTATDLSALAAANIRLLEITFTLPDAPTVIRTAVSTFEKTAIVGAGTVTTVTEARAAVAAGARFLVSPGFVPEVLAFGISQNILTIPGVFTPTEVLAAMQAGAKLLKLFPAEPLGPVYLQALRGPFPQAKFIATGGITSHNAASYLNAGAVAVGMGGKLADNPAAAVAAVHPQGTPPWSM